MNIEELKQRAAAGDAEAMCDLGMAYFHGEGVEQNEEKAVELLQASVDAGDEYAPLLLGKCIYMVTLLMRMSVIME